MQRTFTSPLSPRCPSVPRSAVPRSSSLCLDEVMEGRTDGRMEAVLESTLTLTKGEGHPSAKMKGSNENGTEMSKEY